METSLPTENVNQWEAPYTIHNGGGGALITAHNHPAAMENVEPSDDEVKW